MSWITATGFARRPLVCVEDHLHHVGELLEAVAAHDVSLLEQLTVVCLDRPGPDTALCVERWLAAFPGLQAAAAAGPAAEPRFRALQAELFSTAHRYCREVAALLRPAGLLVQDVQLSTLRFLPEERWWESIYLASTVRGMFAELPPACRFLSNKRGYEATFGRDLLDAGFDPRDVMDKTELTGTVAPLLRAHLESNFPLRLTWVRGEGTPRTLAVGGAEAEGREIDERLDLVLWIRGGAAVELAGRLVAGEGERRRVACRAGSHEANSWSALFADRLAAGPGLPVVEVGRRIGPEGADRAELTNLAARHVHGLRARLEAGGAALRTVDHAYRLDAGLAVGVVRPAGAA